MNYYKPPRAIMQEQNGNSALPRRGGGSAPPPGTGAGQKAGRPINPKHPRAVGAGVLWAGCYLAYSVARLSRMTLTLIWPG